MKLNLLCVFCCFISYCENIAFSQYEIIHTFTNEMIPELHYFNEETIILGGGNYIAKFVNDEITVLDNSFFPEENVIYSFNRVDSNSAFLVSTFPWFSGGTYEIYKTNDNCQTWNKIFDTLRISQGSLIMFDSLEGIHYNGVNQMFRTIDGGYNWEVEYCPTLGIDESDKLNDSILCLGEFYDFMISFNRGKTWSNRSFIMHQPSSFEFISLDTIVACAGGYFAKSTDGGFTWQQKYIGYNSPKIIHEPSNHNTLFIVGAMSVLDEFGNYLARGMIMKSNDFGETWHTYNTGLPTRFLNMEFLNDSVALISGTDGYLIKYFYRDHHLGFEELNDQLSDIKLYPNPASQLQQIEIKTINSENIEISLLDVFGKEIKTVNKLEFQDGVYTASFDLSMLSIGFYVYKIKLNNETKYLKTQKL